MAEYPRADRAPSRQVFHQGDPAPEPFARLAPLEGLGEARKRFEDAVPAFQQITRTHQTRPGFLLKLERQRGAVLGEELGQLEGVCRRRTLSV
jgi:hypothetical protein